MGRQPHDTTSLPKRLREEIGVGNRGNSYQAKKGALGRKARRKAERTEKVVSSQRRRSSKGAQHSLRYKEHKEQETADDSQGEKILHKFSSLPKSILKTSIRVEPTRKRDSLSPPPRLSKGVKAKLSEDDTEILALEKKLKLKNKKLSKDFEEDGLDLLLDGLDGSEPEEDGRKPGKRKRDAVDGQWLESKRLKATLYAHKGGTDSADEVEGSELEGNSEASDKSKEDSDEASFESFDFDNSVSDLPPKKRENPYVAAVTSPSQSAKYVPPSLRRSKSDDTELLLRLRRQLQGLMNRISGANILSILGDVERLYRENARQYITSNLVDLLISLVSQDAAHEDNFIILHAGFIAAIYKVVGQDFGAQTVQSIIERFDLRYAESGRQDLGKGMTNLVALLSHLYNFQVIGKRLIFDYLRQFLAEITEINTELILKVVRNSGPQLRQDTIADGTSALKDIVVMLRTAVDRVGEANLSIRTKFMIETINNLKNNRMKTGILASSIASEHITAMKKTLGSLNTRSLRATEPLGVGLEHIRSADSDGKWWLVGASWKDNHTGDPPKTIIKEGHHGQLDRLKDVELDSGVAALSQIAKDWGMNTEVRRIIFITIMSASDAKDAHMKLMKLLRIKKIKTQEIPTVLICCCKAEAKPNPYYATVARKMCFETHLKMEFHFKCRLWDIFKQMGEDSLYDSAEDYEDDQLDTDAIFKLAKMFGIIIAGKGMGLSALRKLNFKSLQHTTSTFLEVLMITIFLHAKGGPDAGDEAGMVADIFDVRSIPDLSRSLRTFLKRTVSRSDLIRKNKEKEVIRRGCEVARDVTVGIQLT
ncbi:MAG: suppressor of glycerol defect [Vezdaea acicularis]|nr:MAG: suppressor of glycerol defect [Vezdaea acicularis]